ncbi:hypothetical protein GCM10009741_44410 [Kribbella lupini]|uniref:Uncharacterized protein n=2 Tax=Kribbella lupini TaxID=291602 RepID=A0ABN2B9Z6_9ACTN
MGREMLKDGSLDPPPRLVRYATVVFAAVTLVNLRNDHSADEIVFAAFFCLAAVLNIVGAKAMADGRAERWSRAHPVLNGGILVVLAVAAWFVLLSEFFGERIGVLAGFPIGLAFAAFLIYRELNRTADQPADDAQH